MRKKLYVENLSFETTETELKELFTQSGLVETVRIITDHDTGRSKGFGFVEMQEGGDKAIAEMNGKDFNGRALTVNEARPMAFRTRLIQAVLDTRDEPSRSIGDLLQ